MDDKLIIYVLIDKDTGEELAYHIKNGETLAKWLLAEKRAGKNVEIIQREKQHG